MLACYFEVNITLKTRGTKRNCVETNATDRSIKSSLLDVATHTTKEHRTKYINERLRSTAEGVNNNKNATGGAEISIKAKLKGIAYRPEKYRSSVKSPVTA